MKILTNGITVDLQPGDRVVVPITGLILSQHHAIYFGYYHGTSYFIENKIGRGVHLISSEQFFNENPRITRIEKFPGNEFQRQHALQAAFRKIGTRYDLLSYNCEHFSNEVQHFKAYSNQTKVAGAIGILALILLFASAE